MASNVYVPVGGMTPKETEQFLNILEDLKNVLGKKAVTPEEVAGIVKDYQLNSKYPEKIIRIAEKHYNSYIVEEKSVKELLKEAAKKIRKLEKKGANEAADFIDNAIEKSKDGWEALKKVGEKAKDWSVDAQKDLVKILGKKVIPKKYNETTLLAAAAVGTLILVTLPVLYTYAAYEQNKGEEALKKAAWERATAEVKVEIIAAQKAARAEVERFRAIQENAKKPVAEIPVFQTFMSIKRTKDVGVSEFEKEGERYVPFFKSEDRKLIDSMIKNMEKIWIEAVVTNPAQLKLRENALTTISGKMNDWLGDKKEFEWTTAKLKDMDAIIKRQLNVVTESKKAKVR